MSPATMREFAMAHPHADRSAAPAVQTPKPVRRPAIAHPGTPAFDPSRLDAPQGAARMPGAVSRANEIVRAIGLRPITGLSGPKIGY